MGECLSENCLYSNQQSLILQQRPLHYETPQSGLLLVSHEPHGSFQLWQQLANPPRGPEAGPQSQLLLFMIHFSDGATSDLSHIHKSNAARTKRHGGQLFCHSPRRAWGRKSPFQLIIQPAQQQEHDDAQQQRQEQQERSLRCEASIVNPELVLCIACVDSM